MASKSYIPARDEDLAVFANNFQDALSSGPAAYGLLPADITALTPLVSAFTDALGTASNPTLRTPVIIKTKDAARATLVAAIRRLAKRIQATPTVTDVQKTAAGLTVPDRSPTPVPPPATKPLVNVVDVANHTHVIRLADEATPRKRARPAGTAGAEIYAFVATTPGATPPADLSDWQFKGLATKAVFEIPYHADDTGKQAVIVARWYNAKGQTEPISAPVIGTIAA